MFPVSSQKKHWLFTDEKEIAQLREQANAAYIVKHGSHMTKEKRENHFLSCQEEESLLRYWEISMKKFCKNFNPPMPKATAATSLHYFKRFYLRNSVMDYHPKYIMVTCIYLACKVEEFNVSIVQFVANVNGDKEKCCNIIINNELLLMQQLDYHLTIHNPFRPVEGFLIDIRTRFPSLENPDDLRPLIDEFLEKVFSTDAVLIYAPSQIALAAILHAASSTKANLDSYVTDLLLSREQLKNIVAAVKEIRMMVKGIPATISVETMKLLEKKLEKCKNPENDPDSDIYKQRMEEMIDEDDISNNKTYAKLTHSQSECSNDKILDQIFDQSICN
ncbi:cyclin-H [Trichogramma pretiosum]|uniref:cyclin-H n=1 Tax=Trichogramma pretiosum TaxID=7493 RepID=UPI0006C96D2D|nr:cyclin-H [Trichogramma pretiosum]